MRLCANFPTVDKGSLVVFWEGTDAFSMDPNASSVITEDQQAQRVAGRSGCLMGSAEGAFLVPLPMLTDHCFRLGKISAVPNLAWPATECWSRALGISWCRIGRWRHAQVCV